MLAAGAVVQAAFETTDLGGDQYLVRFRYTAPEDAKTVHLAGTFNGWDPRANPMARVDGSRVFVCELTLAKGRYEYKFVVDGGDWRTDLENPNKTDGYGNAIVFLGVTPEDPASTAAQRDAPSMPSPVQHPPEIAEQLEQIAAASPQDRGGLLETFFVKTPMPIFAEDTVIFVWAAETSAPPSVHVFVDGTSLGYPMAALAGAPNIFALSLGRGALPDRWAYVYALQHGGHTNSMRDPHGWSVTTRNGIPVTAGIAASRHAGRVELLPEIEPKTDGVLARDVHVYLPPAYNDSDERYPVLYMHDGQNCWDDPVEPFGHGGWTVNLIADELIAEGKVRPFIVVGVANTSDRMREYGPGPDILSAEAHSYLRFLMDEVKPRVDAGYRTRTGADATCLAGSSLGGAISLQGALLRPDVFGAAACMSPALMFRDANGRGYLDLLEKCGKKEVRMYVDSGTVGPQGDGVESTRALVRALRAAGWHDGEDLAHFEDEGAAHNERSWRARLHRPLTFLFGK
jgi:enterochelin esterase-like enzyme